MKFTTPAIAPLTAAQKNVLEKLQEGWTLKRPGHYNTAFLRPPEGTGKRIAYTTVDALRRRGLIAGASRVGTWTYTLTAEGRRYKL